MYSFSNQGELAEINRQLNKAGAFIDTGGAILTADLICREYNTPAVNGREKHILPVSTKPDAEQFHEQAQFQSGIRPKCRFICRFGQSTFAGSLAVV